MASQEKSEEDEFLLKKTIKQFVVFPVTNIQFFFVCLFGEMFMFQTEKAG